MYAINDDFVSGLLQFVKSGTPTWPPMSAQGRERAHGGATKTLANATAWDSGEII